MVRKRLNNSRLRLISLSWLRCRAFGCAQIWLQLPELCMMSGFLGYFGG